MFSAKGGSIHNPQIGRAAQVWRSQTNCNGLYKSPEDYSRSPPRVTSRARVVNLGVMATPFLMSVLDPWKGGAGLVLGWRAMVWRKLRASVLRHLAPPKQSSSLEYKISTSSLLGVAA